jgi:predicted phosphate transport protein (TIGR00153 family)
MRGREKEVYDECLKHVELMTQGADLLEEAMELLVKGDYDKMKLMVDEIIEIETKCDRKSTEITTQVIKTIQHPSTRSDLLRFIQVLQNVAKMVEGVAYRLDMCCDFRVPDALKQDLLELSDAVVGTVKALKAVSYLPFYGEEALEDIQKIHEHEEKADLVRRKLMCDLIKMGGIIDMADFYLFNEIVDRLEDIADTCQEAALEMEIIIASSEY